MKNPTETRPEREDTRIIFQKDISKVKERDFVSMLHFRRYIFAKSFVKNLNVLDVGCGSGYGSYYLSKYAKKVYGMDSSREAINFANSNFKRSNLQFKIGDACKIPFENKKFDVVTCFDVIEHVDNPKKLLSEIKRALKPSGILVLSTPNKLASLFLNGEINRFHKIEFDMKELGRELKIFKEVIDFRPKI